MGWLIPVIEPLNVSVAATTWSPGVTSVTPSTKV
jgi:hypothetical protein